MPTPATKGLKMNPVENDGASALGDYILRVKIEVQGNVPKVTFHARKPP